jgi:hypothetical protein
LIAIAHSASTAAAVSNAAPRPADIAGAMEVGNRATRRTIGGVIVRRAPAAA